MGRLLAGKLLELSGMMIVVSGLYLGLTDKMSLHYELLSLGLGTGVFYLGYLMERKYRK